MAFAIRYAIFSPPCAADAFAFAIASFLRYAAAAISPLMPRRAAAADAFHFRFDYAICRHF